MRVLIACEYSGVVRDAFLAAGHDAYSCDLMPPIKDDPNAGRHLRKDALRVIADGGWDLVIAHPPCTYLCNSGVRWLRERKGRVGDMFQAAEFFKECLNAKAPRVCVENPIQHGYAKRLIGVEPTQIIQPWQFGHGETKATCLWLRGLSKLEPTNIVDGRAPKVHYASGKQRTFVRSRTYQGVAKAMSQQWGRNG